MNCENLPMSEIIIDKFDVSGLWQIGFRIYYGDKYVSIAPFEEEAYKLFSEHLNDPSWGIGPNQFCKRVNQTYSQKTDALQALAVDLEKTGEFCDIAIEDRPSAIGLPRVLCYKHKNANITTEFDGVLWVSRKKLNDSVVQVADLISNLSAQGAIYVDEAQYGAFGNSVWDDMSWHSMAHCHWIYSTDSAAINHTVFSGHIFMANFKDQKYMTFTSPTGETKRGKDYSLLIGEKSHIIQVIAHEYETLRYLHYLEKRLRLIQKDLLAIKNALLSPAPIPSHPIQWINVREWLNSTKHWISMHRSMEAVIKHLAYLNGFSLVLESFKEYEDKGIGFYNLQNPILSIDGDVKNHNGLSQYPTCSPLCIDVVNERIRIKGYDKSLLAYSGRPERLIAYEKWITNTASDTHELLKSIVSTAGLIAMMIAVILALLALIFSAISLLLSVLR